MWNLDFRETATTDLNKNDISMKVAVGSVSLGSLASLGSLGSVGSVASRKRRWSDAEDEATAASNASSPSPSPLPARATTAEPALPSQSQSESGQSALGPGQRVCAECVQRITDQWVLQVSERWWHVRCLRCSVCRVALDQEASCFMRDDQLYCRADYAKMFGAKCSKCCRSISASDWVRKARDLVYHLACFACDACHRQLSSGEEFALLENRVLCKTHYLETMDLGSTSSDETNSEAERQSYRAPSLWVLHPGRSTTTGRLLWPTPWPTPSLDPLAWWGAGWGWGVTPLGPLGPPGPPGPFGREERITTVPNSPNALEALRALSETLDTRPPMKRTPPELCSPPVMSVPRVSAMASIQQQWKELCTKWQGREGGDSEGYHKNKAKRVRTTFTEEQLQVLQANFVLDSNPDGQDLERIAQVTGLSKRVVQVWFQNARARQKKHLHNNKIKSQAHHSHPAHSAHLARDPRDPREPGDGAFGVAGHINLHLTYSFSGHGHGGPHGKPPHGPHTPPSSQTGGLYHPDHAPSETSSMDELSQDSMLHCMRGEV